MIYIKRIINADITRQIDLSEETASSFFSFDPEVVAQRSLVFLDESTNASYSGSIKKSGHSTTITGGIFSFVKQNCKCGDIVVFSRTSNLNEFKFITARKGSPLFNDCDRLLQRFGSRNGRICSTIHLLTNDSKMEALF